MGLVSFKIYIVPSQNYILRYTHSLFFSFAIHHGHFISIADRTLHGDSSENYFAYTRPANSRLPVQLFSADALQLCNFFTIDFLILLRTFSAFLLSP